MTKTEFKSDKITPSRNASIYVAGPASVAEEIVAKFCMERGACFTVTPTNYIYTGGHESGVIVGAINYPRFPTTSQSAQENLLYELAQLLVEGMHQHSATIEMKCGTLWLTRRPDTAS